MALSRKPFRSPCASTNAIREPKPAAMRQDAASTFLCQIWKRAQDLEDFLKIGADFFQILMNSSGQVRAPRGIMEVDAISAVQSDGPRMTVFFVICVHPCSSVAQPLFFLFFFSFPFFLLPGLSFFVKSVSFFC